MLYQVKPFWGVIAALLLSSCSLTTVGEVTPTLESIPTTATSLPTVTRTPPPAEVSVVVVPQVAVQTATPTPTPEPPTLTPLPTDTPGPYEYVIQEQDTLGFIIQQFGYTDFSLEPGSIIDQVVRLNDNIQSADILPAPGSVILVPRQTATPTPSNEETVVAVQATEAAGPNLTSAGGPTSGHIVEEGETLVSIAAFYDTTLAVLARLNPELDVFSCNLELPSGGPGCNVPLQIGQNVLVPAPTPTPTSSPTPSGNETVTPTPTFIAPILISPPNGAQIRGGGFNLQWVSVGVLAADESYLIQITDLTLSQIIVRTVTQDTSFRIPDSLLPTDGIHEFSWQVWVAKPDSQGQFGPIASTSQERRFSWGS